MEKLYNILYIDPPYAYKNKKTGGGMSSGSVDKYDVLSMEELYSLNLKAITEKDAVLFLWATIPLLPDIFELMKSWGFRYKTMITWRKTMSWGMGFWFRGQTEHLLLGIRGKVKAFRCQRANFLQLKALKHSEKPEEFRQLIELATKDIVNPKRLEVFARKEVNGWDVIGYDVGLG